MSEPKTNLFSMFKLATRIKKEILWDQWWNSWLSLWAWFFFLKIGSSLIEQPFCAVCYRAETNASTDKTSQIQQPVFYHSLVTNVWAGLCDFRITGFNRFYKKHFLPAGLSKVDQFKISKISVFLKKVYTILCWNWSRFLCFVMCKCYFINRHYFIAICT